MELQELKAFLENMENDSGETWAKISELLDDVLETGKIQPFINHEVMRPFINNSGIYNPFIATTLGLKLRDSYVLEFGLSFWCDRATEIIKRYSTNILGVGSGVAFVEYLLQRGGVDIIASDIKAYHHWEHTHMNVEKLSAVDAIEKYPERDLFICWPTLGSLWSYDAAKKLGSGRYLFHVGELTGCTGDPELADYLFDENDFETIGYCCIPQWLELRDCLTIFRKK